MDIITGVILIGLVIAFIGAIFTKKFELSIMAILLVFCSFVAITKDTSISADIVTLLYIPVVAMGLFSIAQFFKSKV